MPVHLPPISRRRFLQSTVAAGASLAALGKLPAAEPAVDPHRFALLSDIHIAADAERIVNKTHLANHLRQAVEQVLQLDVRPARMLVAGDCALGDGRPGDYATIIELLKPIRAASVPIDLVLGNHDDRANFLAALAPADYVAPVKDRHVGVIETPRADWFLLDSLTYDTGRPGRYGPQQLAWLARELDARPNKPALILGHHNAVFPAADGTKRSGGLADTAELFEVLTPRRQVKAYFFGHTHAWRLDQRDGIHLVNLPAVAYPSIQSAWADLQLREDGAVLERLPVGTESVAKEHRYELKWRA